MKKYIDWIVEGVILSAMVIAFLFLVGKNHYGHISFKLDAGVMDCIIAIFACVMAIILLYVKKRDKRYMKVISIIYALENFIIYYVAVGYKLSICCVSSSSRIDNDALFLAFLVGSIAWSITNYEVESIMKQR